MPKKLKQEVIERLHGKSKVKVAIAEEMGTDLVWGVETVRRWIRQNKPNGPLTAKSNLEIIALALNLPEDELLEDCNETNSNGMPVDRNACTGHDHKNHCCEQKQKHSHYQC